MALQAGTIVDGKIINITNFGAFIEVEGETGLVHISEVADTYIKDIKEHLKENEIVKVKILSLENGKISLSIKQANEKKIENKIPKPIEFKPKSNAKAVKNEGDFENIMSKFLKDSEEKFQDIKRQKDSKSKSYSRR